jgi:hypothetical protein
VQNPRHLDLWTALTTGLVDQQISNEPGGDRWIRLIDDAVAMFLAYCATKQWADDQQTAPDYSTPLQEHLEANGVVRADAADKPLTQSAIADEPYASVLVFRDPDNIQLELFAPAIQQHE